MRVGRSVWYGDSWKGVGVEVVLTAYWIKLVFGLFVSTQAAFAHLSPSTGTFLQRDSLEYVNGMSMREYVRSNPVRYLDPRGLFTQSHHAEMTRVALSGIANRCFTSRSRR